MATTSSYIVISQHHYKDTKQQFVTLLVTSGDFNTVEECIKSYINEIRQDTGLDYTASYGDIVQFNVSRTTQFSQGKPTLTSSPSVEGDLQGKKGGYLITAVINTPDRPSNS